MTTYFTTPEKVKDTLNTYGVAIIPSILDDDESDAILSGTWDFLEHITQNWTPPINRTKPETWTQFYKLLPIHSMLLQYWQVGHAQVSWNVRQNIKIAEIYAKLYDCKLEDLIVSFDGLSFNPPPEQTKKGWNKNNLWLHCDQSYTQNDFKTAQGWVTGPEVNEGDATLAILEGSHQYHKEFATTFNITKNIQWTKLTEEQIQFYKERGCDFKRLTCPKGSLVLWDSRTIHCGVEADKSRLKPNFRSIVYVCYAPRSKCSAANIKKRQKAFDELRATIHDPIHPKLFGKNPQTYGKPLPEITPINRPELTEFGLKLAGF